ncbi:MAG: GAF domain-containing protein [Lachnospiraceae bacterium]|jgi:L-methionine (R)-S-oxide reductase|nr:GAF domain-containing protein [Lachnospiraceae bacterium]
MQIQTDYDLILAQLQAVTESEKDLIANLSNASAVLSMNLDRINWIGFYLVRGNQLVLGPFQGRPACVRIEFGKGVCGAAISSGMVQRVDDVHAFPGHIACDGASNSEIVLPLFRKGMPVAVLDIDSPLFNRFSPEDQKGLEQCAAFLEEACGWDSLLEHV